MSGPPKFIDVVRATGLRRYISSTKDEHNGIGWAMWQTMMRVGTPPYQIHKIMGINRARVSDLIVLYEEQYKK